jgi:hypothetical protein
MLIVYVEDLIFDLPSPQLCSNYVRFSYGSRYPAAVLHQLVSIIFSAQNFLNLTRLYDRITQAGQLPFECVRINKSLVRENSFDIADLNSLIRRDVSGLPIAFHSPPS